MIVFLKKISFFILSFFVFIVIPIILISTQDNKDKFTTSNSNIIKLQTKSQFDSLDVLFIGNSYCYSSINPIMLDSVGINSYNLGIATAGVVFYELIINDYLNHIETYPLKVFITISPMSFSSASDNFENYPIHRYLERPISNLEIALKYNHWNELSMMYKKSIDKVIKNLISSNSSVKKLNPKNKGFQGSSVVFSDSIEQQTKPLYHKFKEEEFDNSIYVDLIKIYKNLEDKGIDVVFIEIPTNRLSDYFNNSYLNDYENLINKIGEHAPILRLDSSKFQINNYRNIDHMNSSGAYIATKEIINFIEKESINE